MKMQGPEARAVARAPEWVFRGGDVTGEEGLWFDDNEDDFGDGGGWDDDDEDEDEDE